VRTAEWIGASNGSVVSHCELRLYDSRRKILVDWLFANSEGWKRTAVSRGSFSINFLGKDAILNYAGGQFAHTVEPTVFAALSCDGA
jgi:hypothetical protein